MHKAVSTRTHVGTASADRNHSRICVARRQSFQLLPSGDDVRTGRGGPHRPTAFNIARPDGGIYVTYGRTWCRHDQRKDGPAAVVQLPACLRIHMREARGGGALAPNPQIRVQTRSTGDVQEEERAGGGGPATAENGCCNAKRGVDRCARGSNYVGWGGWQRG